MSACESIMHANPTCRGWGFASPWHGCDREPGHDLDVGAPNRYVHRCRCGARWKGRVMIDDD